jgi:hypothetical protein
MKGWFLRKSLWTNILIERGDEQQQSEGLQTDFSVRFEQNFTL